MFDVVRAIPRGRVATYQQVAGLAGKLHASRGVAWILNSCSKKYKLPWQRVINSQGACSTGRMTMPVNLQQNMLEQEGIVFTENGKCDLREYLWYPEGYKPDDDDQPSLLG